MHFCGCALRPAKLNVIPLSQIVMSESIKCLKCDKKISLTNKPLSDLQKIPILDSNTIFKCESCQYEFDIEALRKSKEPNMTIINMIVIIIMLAILALITL